MERQRIPLTQSNKTATNLTPLLAEEKCISVQAYLTAKACWSFSAARHLHYCHAELKISWENVLHTRELHLSTVITVATGRNANRVDITRQALFPKGPPPAEGALKNRKCHHPHSLRKAKQETLPASERIFRAIKNLIPSTVSGSQTPRGNLQCKWDLPADVFPADVFPQTRAAHVQWWCTAGLFWQALFFQILIFFWFPLAFSSETFCPLWLWRVWKFRCLMLTQIQELADSLEGNKGLRVWTVPSISVRGLILRHDHCWWQFQALYRRGDGKLPVCIIFLFSILTILFTSMPGWCLKTPPPILPHLKGAT